MYLNQKEIGWCDWADKNEAASRWNMLDKPKYMYQLSRFITHLHLSQKKFCISTCVKWLTVLTSKTEIKVQIYIIKPRWNWSFIILKIQTKNIHDCLKFEKNNVLNYKIILFGVKEICSTKIWQICQWNQKPNNGYPLCQ